MQLALSMNWLSGWFSLWHVKQVRQVVVCLFSSKETDLKRIRDLSTFTAIPRWSCVSNPDLLIPNQEFFPSKYSFPFITARKSGLCPQPEAYLCPTYPMKRGNAFSFTERGSAFSFTERGNAFCFAIFELAENKLESQDPPSWLQKINQPSGSDLWGCLLSKLFKHGAQFLLAVLTELSASQLLLPHPWAPGCTQLASRSPGKLGSPRCPLEVRIHMCALQCGEALHGQLTTEWLSCPNTHGWPRSNWSWDWSRDSQACGSWEETDLPNDSLLWYKPFFFPLPLLHRTELLYFQRGQFSSVRNCANSSTIMLLLKGHLSFFPCFHFTLSQFQLVILV